MAYVELHACSAFSFLRGASFPEHLAEAAADLEMPAAALLDRNGVYGAQRFSVAAREKNVRPIVGCELTMADGSLLPVLVQSRTGYENLCELLTQAHLRSEKGSCAIEWEELPPFAEGLVALLGSAGCQPAVCGSLPQTSARSPRSHAKSIRQAAECGRLAACAPQKLPLARAFDRQRHPAVPSWLPCLRNRAPAPGRSFEILSSLDRAWKGPDTGES